MFILTTSVLDPITNDVHFSFRGGNHHLHHTYTGKLKNATRLQGYLAAASGGLAFIDSCYERGDLTFIDVLVADEQIASQLSKQKTPPSRLLHSDNAPLWAEFFAWKRNVDVRFVHRVADSPSIAAVWSWSSVPPIPAFAPKTRAESDQMLDNAKGQN